MITATELDFLRESNNIENEWDDKSLEDAILAWQWIKNKKKLTKTLILEVHQILMDSRDTLEGKHKGAFRDGPVWIGGHEAKPWFAVPGLIDDFAMRTNHQILNKQIFVCELEDVIQDNHVLYESIHPFFDGNGRTGRIFYNWQRIRSGLPIHVIHTGEEQRSYYKWFE